MGGWRAVALVPMLRDGVPIGHISVHRSQPVALDPGQFDLLRTFAAQAVIAIENARLFNETKEGLERQTATAEILDGISNPLTDTQPVFDIIAQRAVALCGAEVSVVSRFDGASTQLAAIHGITPGRRGGAAQGIPVPLDAETATTRAFRTRSIVQFGGRPGGFAV